MYTLKDIDLSGARKSGAWLTQPRIRSGQGGGRWTTGGGSFWKTDPTAPMAGKHARFKDPERDVADSYGGLSVKEEKSFSSIDWDGLMETAADPKANPTEREKAVKQVTMHLEQMKRRVETEKSTLTESHTSSRLTVKTVTQAPKVKPVEHYVKDSTKDAARVAMTQQVLGYAVRAAAAAAALIGAHESEHFIEQLHQLSENLAIESGVNVALTLLITLLVGKIQKAFRERHDRRIAKARGEIE